MEEYHNIADRTMEHLLETMEDMVETRGDDGHEVDYHVRPFVLPIIRLLIY